MTIAISQGDPDGLGLELLIRLFTDLSQSQSPAIVRTIGQDTPLIYVGSESALLEMSDRIGIPIIIKACHSKQDILTAWPDRLPIWAEKNGSTPAKKVLRDPDDGITFVKPENKEITTLSAIAQATRLVKLGIADALTTLPVNKAKLNSVDPNFIGHTDFLAQFSEVSMHSGHLNPVMMMSTPQLRTIPLTVHIPFREVTQKLVPGLLTKVTKIAISSLKSDFDLEHPQLAVLGLNPHAGENGLLGSEELDILLPEVEALKKGGIDIVGPLPADTGFAPDVRNRFDVMLCPTHDQALIPVKALDFDRCVNVTLGLSFVRTSPDHGTAYDLVGSGQGSYQSLLEAIRLAHQISRNRKIYATTIDTENELRSK